jgi:hypothetical protein
MVVNLWTSGMFPESPADESFPTVADLFGTDISLQFSYTNIYNKMFSSDEKLAELGGISD